MGAFDIDDDIMRIAFFATWQYPYLKRANAVSVRATILIIGYVGITNRIDFAARFGLGYC